mmetsp:Transcript_10144/g.25700  ORF Transcript_10144/g.25700 Transcript_10144/m.25700 type:complete len:138 (+) Transcript_10144:344-757(+)
MAQEYMLRRKREDDDMRRARAAAGPWAASVGAQEAQGSPAAKMNAPSAAPSAPAASAAVEAEARSPSCVVHLRVPPHSNLSLDALVQFLTHFGALDGCTIERASGQVAATFAHANGAQACRAGFPSVFGAVESASTS